MSLKSKIDNIANIGVKPNYEPWEIYLTRKINLVTIIGICNVALGLGLFLLIGNYDFIPECVFIFISCPIVIIFNRYKNYIWATYAFYSIGYFFYFFINVRMGLDSFMILNFFPFFVSSIQLLGRREMLKHLFIILILCLVTVLLIFIGFEHDFMRVKLDPSQIAAIKYINIFISFTVTMSFIGSVVIESAKQEKLIKGMLEEKEVLLAEVFHRVKNNMNIVTSLLNLKKNASNSKEVKDALEECRNRVFSMALVHQNIYQSKKFTSLNLSEYVHDLIDELIISNGSSDHIEFLIKCDDVNLELNNAVPFGLILNELITNAFKYAQVPDRKLRIDVNIKKEGGRIVFDLKDNGPGFKGEKLKKGSLGMELINSLSEQLDGDIAFKNEEGLRFNLSFPTN